MVVKAAATPTAPVAFADELSPIASAWNAVVVTDRPEFDAAAIGELDDLLPFGAKLGFAESGQSVVGSTSTRPMKIEFAAIGCDFERMTRMSSLPAKVASDSSHNSAPLVVPMATWSKPRRRPIARYWLGH